MCNRTCRSAERRGHLLFTRNRYTCHVSSHESDPPVGKRFKRRRRAFDSGMLVLPPDPVDARNLERGLAEARSSVIDSAVYVAAVG